MDIKALVSKKELNPNGYPLTPEQECNFARLYMAINVLRHECGLPFIITSGVRSLDDQQRINPGKPRSSHVQAAACDISDKGGEIWHWMLENLDLVEEVGAYLESRAYTPKHVHLQVIAPRSGHRIFLP